MDSDGPLTDDVFYRLVACAAPPQGECAKPFFRWSKPTLTVGIATRARAFLGGKQKRAEAAVVRALQHLNAVEMGLTLRASDDAPDIVIHLLDTPRGAKIQLPEASKLNGLTMANAITVLDVNGPEIRSASIAFSNTLTLRQYESVMLEEITQSLGLVTDIQNPYYRSRSIFSQNSDNSLKTLGAQDKLALIRHYP
ncbi:MAG: DUF2927 domain-containing protein [Marinomonas sp.]